MPTVTIKGKIFALPPLNTGQMRRNLDPILEKIRNLQVAAETAPTDPKALFEMALQTREVQRSQAEIVAMAIGNQYPPLHPGRPRLSGSAGGHGHLQPGAVGDHGRADAGGRNPSSVKAEPLSWGEIYGLIVTATGWTISHLEATPFPDTLDLMDYWGKYPPAHVLLKRFLVEEETAPQIPTEAELKSRLAELGL